MQAAVVAELHPGDVVTDRLHRPPGQGWDEHGHVGLTARRREGGGYVGLLALRRGKPEDEHVLGQPAVVPGHSGGDPQGEALLAQQGVTAVAGAVRPDLPGLREVRDVPVGGITWPRHVGLSDLQGGAHRVHARDEGVVAQHLQNGPTHAGHDPHADRHISRVGQLHADMGDRGAQRTHRERDHVHGPSPHAAPIEAQHFGLQGGGVPPVVGGAGVTRTGRGDVSAILDPSHVVGVR